jgi:NAD(P)H-flavin reductase
MTADRDPMIPLPYRVVSRRCETRDSVTLRLAPDGAPIDGFAPGQFCMLYAHGTGEVAISISGAPFDAVGHLTHTIRDVGPVSHALWTAPVGTEIGVRGPFGTGWQVQDAACRDLVIVAGGVGLAPLRPVVLAALAQREKYGRVIVVVGARDPVEFLFVDELAAWSADPVLEVLQTVDRPVAGWRGRVGFVTEPLAALELSAATTAFLCGPEPMMRFCANVLTDKGVAPEQIRLSLERNMKCGVGLCGHCQFGPLLVCRDGPVLDLARVRELMTVREL